MESEKTHPVTVALPLPLEIAGALMKLIGTAWPAARISTNGDGMTFLIPKGVEAAEIHDMETPEEETGAQLLALDGDGVRISTPQHLAAAALEVMSQAFDDNPDAVKYLEQRVWDRDTQKAYVMTFQRAEGKTPHELRRAAEQELEEARRQIATLEARE